MKNSVCALLFFIVFSSSIFISISSYSQTAKGKWLVGGNFYVAYRDLEYGDPKTLINHTKLNQFGVSPKVGYFLINKLVLGLNTGYRRQESRSNGQFNTHSITTIYSFTPFVRYYMKVSPKLSLFAQGNLYDHMYNTIESESRQVEANKLFIQIRKQWIGRVSFSPGVVFFATEKLGLEIMLGSIGYDFVKENVKSRVDGTTNELNTSIKGLGSFFNSPSAFDNSTVNFGLQFYLGR